MSVINEDDDWTKAGSNILEPEALAKIEQVLERHGPVILEHRFYRGSSAPARLIFDDFDDLVGYVKSRARPGDSFYMWNYAELCRDDNNLVAGKYPDAQGRIPRGGAIKASAQLSRYQSR
jgi:hypothetical protein